MEGKKPQIDTFKSHSENYMNILISKGSVGDHLVNLFRGADRKDYHFWDHEDHESPEKNHMFKTAYKKHWRCHLHGGFLQDSLDGVRHFAIKYFKYSNFAVFKLPMQKGESYFSDRVTREINYIRVLFSEPTLSYLESGAIYFVYGYEKTYHLKDLLESFRGKCKEFPWNGTISLIGEDELFPVPTNKSKIFSNSFLSDSIFHKDIPDFMLRNVKKKKDD